MELHPLIRDQAPILRQAACSRIASSSVGTAVLLLLRRRVKLNHRLYLGQVEQGHKYLVRGGWALVDDQSCKLTESSLRPLALLDLIQPDRVARFEQDQKVVDFGRFIAHRCGSLVFQSKG